MLLNLWSRKIVKIESTRIKNVVVLIPPPVEPGEAPINIKVLSKNKVLGLSADIFTVLNPAVLAVTD